MSCPFGCVELELSSDLYCCSPRCDSLFRSDPCKIFSALIDGSYRLDLECLFLIVEDQWSERLRTDVRVRRIYSRLITLRAPNVLSSSLRS